MMDEPMDRVQALIQTCQACRQVKYTCPEHSAMLNRLCWEAHPNTYYAGKTNAERLASKPEDYGRIPEET